MRLLEALQAGLRAARVPGSVAAKVVAEAEAVLETYRIRDDRELLSLPDWNLWLVVNKSLLSRLTRILRSEGFCHANSFLVSAVMLLDERVARLVREWVKARCSADLDPCCRNPPCCNIA
ncbi:MAG: hypothetical protein GXO15_02700 [Crenarchaeota archaeon]|nr:hypothetical protein [Thermoproteota archaeon]